MEARQSCGPRSTDDHKDQQPAGMDGWGWEMQLGRSAPGVTPALCNELCPFLLTYQTWVFAEVLRMWVELNRS